MKINEVMQLPKETTGELSRRKFLAATVVVGMALAIAEAVRISLTYLKPPPPKGFGGVITPGLLEDFPPGSVTWVRQGRFYLVHNNDGLLAIYQRCTHLGCLVPWDQDKGEFACPCHAGVYNQEGEVVSGPPPRPLDLFNIEISNGELFVDTGKTIQREVYEPLQAVKG